MTRQQIISRFPEASESFIRANLSPEDSCEVEKKQMDQEAKKKRSDFGTKRPRHLNTCQQCKKQFFAAHSLNRKYCSPACAYDSPERCSWIKKKERGSRICAYCGNSFEVKTRSKNSTHCSRQCSGARIGKQFLFLNRRVVERTHVVKKNCKTCGAEFESAKSNHRVFCSIKCSAGNLEMKLKRIKARNATPKPNCYSRTQKGWVEIGGKRFFSRSSWEANYARYLQFQKDNALIVDWDHEPETFWFDGIKRGVCSYLPDFRVTKKSGVEYHEVKGWMDSRSVTKIKRMAKYHPSVKLVVIDQTRYRSIASTASSIIPGWINPNAGKGQPEQTVIEVYEAA